MVLGFASLFVLLGSILIPYTGIEFDEALFTTPLYGTLDRGLAVTVFHKHIPLMVLPYVGTLKTLIYWPILRVFGPNPYSVRLPVVIVGAVTIVLFFKLAERMAGVRAGVLGSLLLATDASFLLTNTYDWGPVALEHLLLVTGCLMFSMRKPVWGSFCFGLALWNKAIFIWALSGLAAAAIAAYLPEVRRTLASRRTVALCVCAFVVGALPLIVYNLHVPDATLRANVHLSTDSFYLKLVSLKQTLNGSGLFGIVVAPETAEMPKTPRSAIGRVSGAIRDRVGPRYSSLFLYAILFALLSAPLWWRSSGRRAAVFAIVFSAVAFLAMAITRYTGAEHHIVLLWPMPQLFVAVAVASLRPKWLGAAAGTALIAANLLVGNQYIVQFERTGSYGLFTDALYPLSDSLAGSHARTIYLVDFGNWYNLNFLQEGRLNLQQAWPTDSKPEAEIAAMLASEGAVFVNRIPSLGFNVSGSGRLQAEARAHGYQRRNIRTIKDSNGRPQFELFSFDRAR
jgi:hypothetical protein